MKSFESYLLTNEVIRVSTDKNLIKSLVDDAINRMEYHTGLKLTLNNSKYIFENCYEAVRELLDALLLMEGYKSYSHQAPIVYARDKDIISHRDAIIMDRLRDKRNKSKYYGKKINRKEVGKDIIFLKYIFKKVLQSLKDFY